MTAPGRPWVRGALAALFAVLVGAPAVSAAADCAAPQPVCELRRAVLPVAGYQQTASALRLDGELLVTNRHVVADLGQVTVMAPQGPVEATVVPSAYAGDLVLLRAPDLEPGPTVRRGGSSDGPLYLVAVDVARRAVTVGGPGARRAAPAAGHPLARLHHDVPTRPGNSGGALVDGSGRLVGVAASGGEGRYEAVPAHALDRLTAQSGAGYEAAHRRIAAAVAACFRQLVRLQGRRGGLAPEEAAALAGDCRAGGNRQDFDSAAQVLARAGYFEVALDLLEDSLAQDPNGVNTRLTHAIALQMAGRYGDSLVPLRWLLARLPDDPEVLQLALQAGKWGDAPEMAEAALQRLARHDPARAEAARRLLDADVAPPRLAR